MSNKPRQINLHHLAEVAVREAGFLTEHPDEVRAELDRMEVEADARRAAAGAGVTDMRSLPWCSIDNDDSRDLDQVQCAERLDDGRIRLLVGIADVDAW